MLIRHVSSILMCLLAIWSCAQDKGSEPGNVSLTNPLVEKGESIQAYPTSFNDASKLKLESSGIVSLVQGMNLSRDLESHQSYQQLAANESFAEMAVEFIHFFKVPFQLKDPKNELRVTRVNGDDLGFHQVRLAQNYESIPVLNSELIVHFDKNDHVYLVQGQYIQSPNALDLKPRMTAEEVNQVVIDHGYAAAEITDPSPLILPLSDGQPKLVYQLSSNASLTDRSILLVDANNGEVIRKLPTIYNTN